MVTRILWLVSLLCAVGTAQDAGRALGTQWIKFIATVQDSGTFMGAKCDSKSEKCAAYERKLCEFIREPLIPLGPPYKFCEMLSHSDRTKENTMDVQLQITLLDQAPANQLLFLVQFKTFGAVLNQSLHYFHNTPEASVTITEFVAASTAFVDGTIPSKDTVELTMTGTLTKNEKAVAFKDEEKCEIEKDLFNLDLGSELLNVMYKYSPKTLISLSKGSKPDEVTLKLSYPKNYFEQTGIDYTHGFREKIKWGIEHPTNTKNYYLQEITTIEATEKDAQTPTEPLPMPFEFTALVQDDGKLYGTKCGGSQEQCIEYKQKLCQLAQKPIRCGRVPTSWESCSVDVLSKRQADKSLQAKIKLSVLAKADYPITYAPLDSCPTFAGMYKLAFASQSANPKLDITEFTPSLKSVAITTEEVEIQIKGTLLKNSDPVESGKWKSKAEEKVKADLLALSLPDEMLNTFYHLPSRKLKDFKVDTSSPNVIATLTISYPKTVFEENAIDPGCDLNGMLQWGIRSAKTTKGYSFANEDQTVVQNSAAAERSTSFTFEATVTDNGKFQGAECSGVSGQCVEYKEKLCAFVRKAFISSEIESAEDCLIRILSDRTEESKDKLNVKISLQLDMHASKLQFDVSCPTFGWVLNEAFQKLYNAPGAKLEITNIETLQSPPATAQPSPTKYVVYQVKGSLHQNGKPVDSTTLQNINECEVNKQLATLDMGEDLLNVMYMYNRDNIFFERNAEDKKLPQFTFKLYYNKEYFQPEKINPDCDFADKLQWGFRHPVSKDQFYMGEDTIVERVTETNPNPEPITPQTITYTATINDGGKLNDIECDPKTESCTAYESQLCQLMEEPLLCNRVPNQPNVCTVKNLQRNDNGITGEITLGLRDGKSQDDIPPISDSMKPCNTFGVLHSLAFKTFYDSPTVDLKIKPSAPAPVSAIQTDPVVFKVTGKLLKNGKEQTEITDLHEVKYQLANLQMPGKLLPALYKYNNKRSVTFTKPIDKGPFDGNVEFTVSYGKKDLEEIGFDSTCDLQDMLRWGFRNSKDLNEYSLSADADVLEQ